MFKATIEQIVGIVNANNIKCTIEANVEGCLEIHEIVGSIHLDNYCISFMVDDEETFVDYSDITKIVLA